MALRKQIVVVVMALLIVALSSVANTVALLSDSRTVDNTFTRGEVKVELIDTSSGGALAPGQQIPKTPKVKNSGTVDCYVRVKITISDTAALPPDQAIRKYITLDGRHADWEIKTDDPAWLSQSDEYTLYYKYVLRPQDETPNVIESITLKTENAGKPLLEGVDAGNGFSIDVVAEAVQATNGNTQYTSAFNAFAAFDGITP